MIPILVLKTENKVIYNKSNLNCKTFFEEFIYGIYHILEPYSHFECERGLRLHHVFFLERVFRATITLSRKNTWCNCKPLSHVSLPWKPSKTTQFVYLHFL